MDPEEAAERNSRVRATYKKAEDAGRQAVLGWLGNPWVREFVEILREPTRGAVAPLAAYLDDQVAVTLFVARALEVTGAYPSGEEWSNPFPRWIESGLDSNIAEACVTRFRALVELLATELHARDVPLDLAGDGDLFVLGQLLLLSVDWSVPAQRLIENLRVIGVGGISRDARYMTLSRHAGGSDSATLDRIRRQLRDELGADRIRRPYAKGATRRAPTAKRVRQEGLRRVLAEFPDCSTALIRTTWDLGSTATPGGLFRHLIKARCPTLPSRRTLDRDLEDLRQAPD